MRANASSGRSREHKFTSPAAFLYWSGANRRASPGRREVVDGTAPLSRLIVRGQSLGKSSDVGAVEYSRTLLCRRLNLPATLPHDPSALQCFLEWRQSPGLRPAGERSLIGQRRCRGLWFAHKLTNRRRYGAIRLWIRCRDG